MGLFETMVQNMQRMEFFQYLFPFLLAFAILYGLLQWVFKEGLGGKRVHTLISVVFAFFVMLYSSMNPWLYTFLTTTSGVWLGIATVILFIVMIAALAGVNIHEVLGGKETPKWVKYAVIVVIIYIALVAFLGQGGLFSAYLPYWLTGSDLWTVIFVIIILAIVFGFVGGEGKREEAPAAPAPALGK